MSIFDVRDLDNPKRIQQISIGARGTNSEALHDHRAYRYIAEEGMVVIPVDLYEGGSGASDSGTYKHSSFQIYRASIDNGFELVGESLLNRVSAGYWWNIQRGSRSFYRDGILSLIGGREYVLRSAVNPSVDLYRRDLN